MIKVIGKVYLFVCFMAILWMVASYFNIILNNLDSANYVNYWDWNFWILLSNIKQRIPAIFIIIYFNISIYISYIKIFV